jgi:hypothetical protein
VKVACVLVDDSGMAFDSEEQWRTVEIDRSLVGGRAGGTALDRAHELRREAPLRAIAARLTGTHTDERAWSKGASGERWASWWLNRLPDGWYVFDDVPIGTRGANIDHVVIGPAGVLTVNTKHLSGKVWVGPRSFLHNGHRTDYLPKAAREAERAARHLSAAVGRPVAVKGCIAVFADEITIKQQPVDVLAATPRGVKRWLLEQAPTLTPREVIDIAAAAAKPETWCERRSSRRPPGR